VREELRESLQANKVHLRGIEMPTAISNLSGFDAQHGMFSEQERQRDVEEVRDALKFAVDVGSGGGIDILSWEYERNFSEAPWNKKMNGKFMFTPPEGSELKETVKFVDKITGKMQAFRKGEENYFPFDPNNFDPGKPFHEQFAPMDAPNSEHGNFRWEWDDIKKIAAKAKEAPVQLIMKLHEAQELHRAESYAEYYQDEVDRHKEQAKQARAQGREDIAKEAEKHAERTEGLVRTHWQQVKQLEQQQKRFVPLDEFALSRATESYAELGMAAMDGTHKSKDRIEKPLYVGPETGWSQFYGSHPDEFVELIREARQKMAERLVAERHMDKEAAEREARDHIKGTFDTSHFGMFFQHFMPEADYDTRKKEFSKWYLEEVRKLAEVNAKEQVLGGVQLVNSMSGAHGHLPPTQGIFPVVEAAKMLVKEGKFDGFLVSEGHEEEKIQKGRIVLDAWRAFDPAVFGSYAPAGSAWNPRWTETHQGYFGKPYSPTFIVGDFAPSQDWKLWSEVPLE
jgi:hypothetical protein